jgi:hypothetical protein
MISIVPRSGPAATPDRPARPAPIAHPSRPRSRSATARRPAARCRSVRGRPTRSAAAVVLDGGPETGWPITRRGAATAAGREPGQFLVYPLPSGSDSDPSSPGPRGRPGRSRPGRVPSRPAARRTNSENRDESARRLSRSIRSDVCGRRSAPRWRPAGLVRCRWGSRELGCRRDRHRPASRRDRRKAPKSEAETDARRRPGAKRASPIRWPVSRPAIPARWRLCYTLIMGSEKSPAESAREGES